MKQTILLILLGAGVFLNAGSVQTEMMKNFIKNCLEMAEDPWDKNMEGSSFNWSFEGEYKVVFANKKFFSYRCRELVYTGGAHGSLKVSVGTYWRAAKRRLTLNDIAPSKRVKAELLKKVREGVMKHFKCRTQAELTKHLLDEPFLTENFYLDTRGIHFVFNEYEIACKGAGPLDIVVPLGDAAPLPGK